MKDKLPKGRAVTATKNDVGRGKVRAGGKSAQTSLNKMLSKRSK